MQAPDTAQAHFLGIDMPPFAVAAIVVLLIALVIGGIMYAIWRRNKEAEEYVYVPPTDPHKKRQPPRRP